MVTAPTFCQSERNRGTCCLAGASDKAGFSTPLEMTTGKLNSQNLPGLPSSSSLPRLRLRTTGLIDQFHVEQLPDDTHLAVAVLTVAGGYLKFFGVGVVVCQTPILDYVNYVATWNLLDAGHVAVA